MIRLILLLLILSFSGISNAQMIKSFDYTKEYKADSSIITYHVKIGLSSNSTDATRIAMLKFELNKRFHIQECDIIDIQSWIGKKFRTFVYSIKIKNPEKKP